MSQYELAQLNIATMKEPLESPIMADFVANLDRINALAGKLARFRVATADGRGRCDRPVSDG